MFQVFFSIWCILGEVDKLAGQQCEGDERTALFASARERIRGAAAHRRMGRLGRERRAANAYRASHPRQPLARGRVASEARQRQRAAGGRHRMRAAFRRPLPGASGRRRGGLEGPKGRRTGGPRPADSSWTRAPPVSWRRGWTRPRLPAWAQRAALGGAAGPDPRF